MEIKKYLENLGIKFKEFKHGAVYTVEEARNEEILKNVRGVHCKNLFLKERKGRGFYLVVMPEDKKLDMNELGKKLGEKIKFANENELKNILSLKPGSVSPFGLINDKENKVKLIIDKDVWEADFVSFHPNINNETLEISKKDFHKYVKSLINSLEFIEQKP
jgi:Ala-tRNA(Pro) deacylase